jgi:hypothetical protein
MGVTLLALARFTLRGPASAAAVIGLLAVSAVIVPPMLGFTPIAMAIAFVLTTLAAILVGLIILTQGMLSGVKAIAASLAGIVLVTWALLDSPQEVIKLAVIYWLPIIVLAQALRASNSLALMLLVGVVLGAVGILLQQVFRGELESIWIAQFVEQSGAELSDENLAQLQQLVELLMMFSVPSLYLAATLTMMAARWAQIRLSQDAGFDREFQALRFGRSTAIAALLTVPLGIWLQQPWIFSVIMMLMIAFMYQGIAVAHNRLARKNMPTMMFVMFYMILIMLSQFAVVVVAITGILDNWLNMRSLPGKAS